MPSLYQTMMRDLVLHLHKIMFIRRRHEEFCVRLARKLLCSRTSLVARLELMDNIHLQSLQSTKLLLAKVLCVWLELVLPPLIASVIFNLVEQQNSLTSLERAVQNVRKVRINLRDFHFQTQLEFPFRALSRFSRFRSNNR
jgi:hypothetical protein